MKINKEELKVFGKFVVIGILISLSATTVAVGTFLLLDSMFDFNHNDRDNIYIIIDDFDEKELYEKYLQDNPNLKIIDRQG